MSSSNRIHSQRRPRHFKKRPSIAQDTDWPDATLQTAHDFEKEHPSQDFPVLPILLVFLFSGSIFWASFYLVRHSGSFSAQAYDPLWKPDLTPVKAVAFDPIQHGGKVFKRNCLTCHQATGTGIASVYPPLDGSEWVIGEPAALIHITLAGLSGPIEVKGNTYNNIMIPFAHLSDRDIAAVLTYIRQAWGNKAPAVTEEQVATIRAASGGRTTPWSAEELLKTVPPRERREDSLH